MTDEASLAGIVRAWQSSKKTGVRLIVGTEIRLADGPTLVLLAKNLAGYQHICQLITKARRRAKKGSYELRKDDLNSEIPGVVVLWIPGRSSLDSEAQWVAETFPCQAWIAVELHHVNEPPETPDIVSPLP